jgi:hypothetical protein
LNGLDSLLTRKFLIRDDPLISGWNMSCDQRVLSYLDAHRGEVVSFMQKLIQIKGVTGDESEIG